MPQKQVYGEKIKPNMIVTGIVDMDAGQISFFNNQFYRGIAVFDKRLTEGEVFLSFYLNGECKVTTYDFANSKPIRKQP